MSDMEGPWLVAFIALCVVVTGELLAIVGLVHQVGLLHVRLGPAPGPLVPTDVGLPVGAEAPRFEALDIVGETPLTVPAQAGIPLVLLFVEPGCSACIQLLPKLN